MKSKLFLFHLIFAIILMTTFILIGMSIRKNSLQAYAALYSESLPHIVQDRIRPILKKEGLWKNNAISPDRQEELKKVLLKLGVYDFIIFDQKGDLAAQSGQMTLPENFKNDKNALFWKQLQSEIAAKGYSSLTASYSSRIYLSISGASHDKHWILGILFENQNAISSFSQVAPFFWLKIALGALLFLLLAIALYFILIHYTVSPVKILLTTLHDINMGKWNTRTYYYNNDDFGILAEEIDHLADAYENAMEELEALQSSERIVESNDREQLPDPVFASEQKKVANPEAIGQAEEFHDLGELTEDDIDLDIDADSIDLDANMQPAITTKEANFPLNDDLDITSELDKDLSSEPELQLQQSAEEFATIKNSGMEAYKNKNFSKALQDLEKAISINPDDTESLLFYSDTLLHLEKNEAALQTYKKVLLHFPGEPDIFFKLGLLNYRLGNLHEAAAQMEKAIDLKTSYHDAWLYAGVSYANQGNYQEALRVLEGAQQQGIYPDEIQTMIQQIQSMQKG